MGLGTAVGTLGSLRAGARYLEAEGDKEVGEGGVGGPENNLVLSATLLRGKSCLLLSL